MSMDNDYANALKEKIETHSSKDGSWKPLNHSSPSVNGAFFNSSKNGFLNGDANARNKPKIRPVDPSRLHAIQLLSERMAKLAKSSTAAPASSKPDKSLTKSCNKPLPSGNSTKENNEKMEKNAKHSFSSKESSYSAVSSTNEQGARNSHMSHHKAQNQDKKEKVKSLDSETSRISPPISSCDKPVQKSHIASSYTNKRCNFTDSKEQYNNDRQQESASNEKRMKHSSSNSHHHHHADRKLDNGLDLEKNLKGTLENELSHGKNEIHSSKKHKHLKDKDKSKSPKSDSKSSEKDKKRETSHSSHEKNSKSSKKEAINERASLPEPSKEGEGTKPNKINLSEYLKMRKEKSSSDQTTQNKNDKNSQDEILSHSPLASESVREKSPNIKRLSVEKHLKECQKNNLFQSDVNEQTRGSLPSPREKSSKLDSNYNPTTSSEEFSNNKIIDFTADANTSFESKSRERHPLNNNYSPPHSHSCGNIVIDFDVSSKSSKSKIKETTPSYEKKKSSEIASHSNKVIDFAEHPKKKESKKKKSSEHSKQSKQDLKAKSSEHLSPKVKSKREEIKDALNHNSSGGNNSDNNTIIDFETPRETKKSDNSNLLSSDKHTFNERSTSKKEKKKEKIYKESLLNKNITDNTDFNLVKAKNTSEKITAPSDTKSQSNSSKERDINLKQEERREKRKKETSFETSSGNKIIDFDDNKETKSTKGSLPNCSQQIDAKTGLEPNKTYDDRNKAKKDSSQDLLHDRDKTFVAKSDIKNNHSSNKTASNDPSKCKSKLKTDRSEEGGIKSEMPNECNSKYKGDDNSKKEKEEQSSPNDRKKDNKNSHDFSKENRKSSSSKTEGLCKDKIKSKSDSKQNVCEKIKKDKNSKYGDGNKIIDFKTSTKEGESDKNMSKSKHSSKEKVPKNSLPKPIHDSKDPKVMKNGFSNGSGDISHPLNETLAGDVKSVKGNEKTKPVLDTKTEKKIEYINKQKENFHSKTSDRAREETSSARSKSSLSFGEKKNEQSRLSETSLKRKSPEGDFIKAKKMKVDNVSNNMAGKREESARDHKPSILPLSGAILGQNKPRPPLKLHPLHRDFKKFQEITASNPPSLLKQQEPQADAKESKGKTSSKDGSNKTSKDKMSKPSKESIGTSKDQPSRKEVNNMDLMPPKKKLKSSPSTISKAKIEIPEDHPFLEELNTSSKDGKMTKDNKEKDYTESSNCNNKIKSDFKEPPKPNIAKNFLLNKKAMDKYSPKNAENKPPFLKSSNIKPSTILPEGHKNISNHPSDLASRQKQKVPSSIPETPVYIPTPKSKLAQLHASKKPAYQEYDPTENVPKSLSYPTVAEYVPTKISLLQEKKKLREMSNIPKPGLEYKPTPLPRDERGCPLPVRSSPTIPAYYPTNKRPLPPPAKLPPIGSYYNKLKKRKVLSSEEEDEYDAEMDDFIDDGPVDGVVPDYSTIINGVLKEVFNYDKTKYIGVDDDDDEAMESSYLQQLKEERRSTRIGLMEDLEDMEREEQEKERRALKAAKKKAKGGPKRPRKAYGNSFIF